MSWASWVAFNKINSLSNAFYLSSSNLTYTTISLSNSVYSEIVNNSNKINTLSNSFYIVTSNLHNTDIELSNSIITLSNDTFTKINFLMTSNNNSNSLAFSNDIFIKFANMSNDIYTFLNIFT